MKIVWTLFKKMCENFYYEDENEKFELYLSKLIFSALFRDPVWGSHYFRVYFIFLYQNLSFVNDFMKIAWTS